MAAVINDFIGEATAEPIDPSTVTVQIPKNYKGNMIQLLTEIEQLRVEPDQRAPHRHRRALRHHRYGA